MADEFRVSIVLSGRDEATRHFEKLNRELGQTSTRQRDVVRESRNVSGAFDGVKTAVLGAVTAYAGMKGLQIVGEMRQQGRQAQIAQETFAALSGGVAQYEQSLQKMRTASLNIVDDTTLMVAGGQLLKQGLASNGDELARFTEIAVKLKKPTLDNAEAMSAFTSMLANQSIPRLDEFGLSSGKVRERVNELVSTMGVARDEAFKMAVLEEAAISLEKLGPAADAAGGAVERLQTRWENAMGAIEVSLAGLLDTAAGTVENLLVIFDRDFSSQVNFGVNTRQNDPELVRALAAAAGGASGSNLSQAQINDIVDRALPLIKAGLINREEVGGAMTAERSNIAATLGFGPGTPQRVAEVDVILQSMFANMDRFVDTLERRKQIEETLTRLAENDAGLQMISADLELRRQMSADRRVGLVRLENQEQREAARLEAQRMALAGQAGMMGQMFVNMRLSQLNPQREHERGLQELVETSSPYILGRSEMGERPFFSRGDAEKASQFADEMAAKAKEFEESGHQFADEMKNVAEDAEAWASQVERGADAFERAVGSLDALAGRGSGGVTGQVGDLLLARLEGKIPDSEYQALKTSLDFQSGKETAQGQFLSQEFPAILEKEFMSGGTPAVQNMLARFGQMQTPEFLSLPAAQQMMGYQLMAGGRMTAGMGGQQFTVSAGDTPGGLAQMMGVDVNTILQATGAADTRSMPTGTFALPGGELTPFTPEEMEAMESQLESMGINTGTFADNFGRVGVHMESVVAGVQAVDGMVAHLKGVGEGIDLDRVFGAISDQLSGNIPDKLQMAATEAGNLTDNLGPLPTIIGFSREPLEDVVTLFEDAYVKANNLSGATGPLAGIFQKSEAFTTLWERFVAEPINLVFKVTADTSKIDSPLENLIVDNLQKTLRDGGGPSSLMGFTE